MTGGMQVAGGAMTNFARRHDVISNNVANVSTRGFARHGTFLHLVEEGETQGPPAVPILGTHTDFTPGAPILTGNHLDLALEGTGFFTVQTDEGVRLTRVASLVVDAEGFLRTIDGPLLLGENGPIPVARGLRDGDGTDVVVEKDGSVFVDGSMVDVLRLVTFRSGDQIEREPAGLYRPRPGATEDPEMLRPIVHSGQVEGSSVCAVDELVKMIEAMRAYDAAASALRATDDTVDRAVNDIARV